MCCEAENIEETGDVASAIYKIEALYKQLIKAREAEIRAREETIKTKDCLIKELYAKIELITKENQNTQADPNITSKTKVQASLTEGTTTNENKPSIEERKHNQQNSGKGNNIQRANSTNSAYKIGTTPHSITAQQVKFALQEQEERAITDKLIHINNDQESWQQVRWKRDRGHNSKPKRLGTAENIGSQFQGAEKRVWLFVNRVNNNTTQENVTSYIKGKQGFSDEKITVKELPGEPNQLKRFVVCAPFNKKDELYNPEFWPKNVGIRRFDFKRHSQFMKTQGASFS